MRSRKKQPDYGSRYAENWGTISRFTKDTIGGTCCYPGCPESSTETHHALYKDKEGAIAGREIPGIHVFPLCDQHHKLAHNRRHWRKDPYKPELGNKNTPSFYLLLRKGWQDKKS